MNRRTYTDEDGYTELGADLPHTFWTCERCNEQNSCFDGECQYCEDEEDAKPTAEPRAERWSER